MYNDVLFFFLFFFLSMYGCYHMRGGAFVSFKQGGAKRVKPKEKQRKADQIQSQLSLRQISFIRLVVC